MALKEIYRPETGRAMQVAGFMSGSGTNLVKILEYQDRVEAETGKKPYEVNLVFTDNEKSNAAEIANSRNIPLVVNDIMDFYCCRGHKDKKDMELRVLFDRTSVEMLAEYQFDIVAMAGYMSIITEPIFEAFGGRLVNVHPADLSVEDDGVRRYRGDRAVHLAIRYGEKYIHATTHLVTPEVDSGQLLLISAPVRVELPEGMTLEELTAPKNKALFKKVGDENQDRLKEQGDWEVFPRTLEMIGQGRFALDECCVVHLDGEPIPQGLRLKKYL